MKNESALKVTLYRLVRSGKIERLSKGRFYKPKKGIVGNLKPDEYEIVKDLLKDGNKITEYITGYSIFNSFKLTTQVPNVIQIGANFDKKGIKRNIYTMKFVRQWNKISKNNIPLLQLLDCIRFIKTIPDTTIEKSYSRILNLIKISSSKEKVQFVNLALNYPPLTRVIIGSMLEKLNMSELFDKLFFSLKSTTWFNINILEGLIENTNKWRIKSWGVILLAYMTFLNIHHFR